MIALIDIAHFLFNDLAPELKMSHKAASAEKLYVNHNDLSGSRKNIIDYHVFLESKFIRLPELQSISIFPSGLTANLRPTACLASAILFQDANDLEFKKF